MGKKRNIPPRDSSGGDSTIQESKSIRTENKTEPKEMHSTDLLADNLDNIQKLMNDSVN